MLCCECIVLQKEAMETDEAEKKTEEDKTAEKSDDKQVEEDKDKVVNYVLIYDVFLNLALQHGQLVWYKTLDVSFQQENVKSEASGTEYKFICVGETKL